MQFTMKETNGVKHPPVVKVTKMQVNNIYLYYAAKHTHTHTRLTALFRDYLGEPVPER